MKSEEEIKKEKSHVDSNDEKRLLGIINGTIQPVTDVEKQIKKEADEIRKRGGEVEIPFN